jgi:hypothetical protein
MPSRRDDDEDLIARLVSESGDPTVEPRPEHLAALRARLLDHLGPPRAARPWRMWLLVGTALAACLLAVLAWFPPHVEHPGPGRDPNRAGPQVTHRPPDDPPGRAPRPEDTEAAELPAFRWPLQETASLMVSSPVTQDLLD